MSKSAAFGIAIPCEIRSKVTHLGGRGLVAIQATHGPLQHLVCRNKAKKGKTPLLNANNPPRKRSCRGD